MAALHINIDDCYTVLCAFCLQDFFQCCGILTLNRAVHEGGICLFIWIYDTQTTVRPNH